MPPSPAQSPAPLAAPKSVSRRRWRTLLRRTAWTVTAWSIVGALALAQQPGAAPDAGSPPTGGSTVVVSGRTLYVEGALVLVMFGAALFAVCRSSRRN
jgi:hypothetical protein